jgi:hypothetical protein
LYNGASVAIAGVRVMIRPVVAAIVLAALVPSCVTAFEAIDAGEIHDVGVPWALSAGMVPLDSSETLMVGNAIISGLPIFTRVAADGTVSSTQLGPPFAGLDAVWKAPDETLIVAGSPWPPTSGTWFGRSDLSGNVSWTQHTAAPWKLSRVVVDTAGVTALEMLPDPVDVRLRHFGLDGSEQWETLLSEAAGCAPDCPHYAAVASALDPDTGVIVLSTVTSPAPETRLFEISLDGTLLWQAELTAVNFGKLARGVGGRLAVIGRAADSGELLLQVRESDGLPMWDLTIAGEDEEFTTLFDVAIDDAGVVYTLGVDGDAYATSAFLPAGELRWTERWTPPDGLARAFLAVGPVPQPIYVLRAAPLIHRISQDGSPMSDTAFDLLYTFALDWHRFPDGSLAALGQIGGEMALARVSADGSDVRYATPGPVEVPTAASPDDIAWHSDGEKTVLAVGGTLEGHAFLARLAANGDERWRVDLSRSGFARAVGNDSLVTDATNDPDFATRLQRIDANGTTLWQVEGPAACYDLAARDDGSSFLVSAFFVPLLWTLDHHDASGQMTWSAPLAMAPASDSGGGGPDAPRITLAHDGGAFVHGRTSDGVMAVERYAADGARLWAFGYGGLAYGWGKSGLVEDDNGNLYLAYEVNAYPELGDNVLVLRLTGGGEIARETVFEQESMAFSGRELIPARGGGALLLTSLGVHRLAEDVDVTWTYADACESGCVPQAIRERDDGHVFALSSIDRANGAQATRLVELDAEGNRVDAWVSTPRPQIRDEPIDLHVDGALVDVALQSARNDDVARVRFLELDPDGIFADGFDPAG